jgi:prophage DNA circulation protein
VYEVPQQMSLARIAALVYGDATKTDLLRKANRIPDESFVPLGTVLVLPEAS